MATCWLNSCLQLVLSAMDQSTHDYLFNSELGIELKRLQLNHSRGSLDPTNVKDIIVTCEDTRIATHLSELEMEAYNILYHLYLFKGNRLRVRVPTCD